MTMVLSMSKVQVMYEAHVVETVDLLLGTA